MDESQDKISHLPEELKALILACLPLKEAGKTAILSRNWRHSWKNRLSLDFTLDAASGKYLRSKNWPEYSEKLVKFVTCVLDGHKSEKLDFVKLVGDLCDRNAHDIDTWIDYFFRRKVRHIELDFHATTVNSAPAPGPGSGSYFLPFINPQLLNFLETLKLKNVAVNPAMLDVLFSCPCLVNLIVDGNMSVENLEYSGVGSRRLKNLEIMGWKDLVSVRLSNFENLLAVKIQALKTLELKNFHHLTDLSLTNSTQGMSSEFLLQALSSLPHLKALRLCPVNLENIEPEELIELTKSIQLPRLKKFELALEKSVQAQYPYDSLDFVAEMLSAVPALEDFTLKVWRPFIEYPVDWGGPHILEPGLALGPRIPALTTFRFCGYYHSLRDLKLVVCVASSSESLRTIFLDFHTTEAEIRLFKLTPRLQKNSERRVMAQLEILRNKNVIPGYVEVDIYN